MAKFFLAYILLSFIYQSYLAKVVGKADFFTENVSYLTEWVAQAIGMDYTVFPDNPNEQFKVIYNNVYQIRIIEGCNAISVIILFIAFIVAFSGKFKPTLLYIIGGSVLIYILNILRIVLLTVLFNRFPEYEHLLHGVLFPLIIYGIVFLLWVIWVNRYSKYAVKK